MWLAESENLWPEHFEKQPQILRCTQDDNNRSHEWHRLHYVDCEIREQRGSHALGGSMQMVYETGSSHPFNQLQAKGSRHPSLHNAGIYRRRILHSDAVSH